MRSVARNAIEKWVCAMNGYLCASFICGLSELGDPASATERTLRRPSLASLLAHRRLPLISYISILSAMS